MTATNKKILEQEPGEIEALLPWHAAGTLSARDSRRVEDALARDRELAKQYAVIQEEYAETIALNESLGAPSSRAMAKLFAAIDAEPVRKPSASLRISAGIAEFFSSLSPRTLAFAAALGALALLLQAGVIGAILSQQQPGSFQTASLSGPKDTVVRSLGQETPSARFGAIREGRAHVRHHGISRCQSGFDHRQLRGRHVPHPVRRQADVAAGNRRADDPAAE